MLASKGGKGKENGHRKAARSLISDVGRESSPAREAGEGVGEAAKLKGEKR